MTGFMDWRWIRLSLLVGVCLVVTATAAKDGEEALTGKEKRLEYMKRFLHWMEEEGFWKSVLAVGGSYTLFVTLCIPVNALLTAAAGFLWGFWTGLGVIWMAHMASAMLSFGIGRTLLASIMQERLRRNQRCRRVLEVMKGGTETFKMALLLRLSPLPQSADNYLLSVTAIPVSTYAVSTAIGFLPVLAEIVWAGTVARAAAESSDDEAEVRTIAVKCVLIVLSVVALTVLSHRLFALIFAEDTREQIPEYDLEENGGIRKPSDVVTTTYFDEDEEDLDVVKERMDCVVEDGFGMVKRGW